MQNQVGGLDVIIGQIEKESKAVIAGIESTSESETSKIISEAKDEADRIVAEAKAVADKIYSETIERDKSAMDHDLSRNLLSEKQKLLDNIIDDVIAGINDSHDEKYFDFLKALLKKYAGDGAGELLLSERDVKGMPHSFKKFLAADYPNLRIKFGENVDSGFIITYDDVDVEENCTLSELTESAMDVIKEKAQNEIFA